MLLSAGAASQRRPKDPPGTHVGVELRHPRQVQLAGVEVKHVLAAPEAAPVPLDGGGHGGKVSLRVRAARCSVPTDLNARNVTWRTGRAVEAVHRTSGRGGVCASGSMRKERSLTSRRRLSLASRASRALCRPRYPRHTRWMVMTRSLQDARGRQPQGVRKRPACCKGARPTPGTVSHLRRSIRRRVRKPLACFWMAIAARCSRSRASSAALRSSASAMMHVTASCSLHP